MMKKSVILLFSILLFLPLVIAAYQEDVELSLLVSCENINCSANNNLTVTYPNSSLLVDNLAMTSGSGYFNYTLTPTVSGIYFYFVDGDDGTAYSGTFEVTPNGEEITTGKALIYLGLFSLFLILLITCFIYLIFAENIALRVGLICVMYLLGLGLLTVSTVIAEDFLVNIGFLDNVLEMLLIVSLICFFPFIIVIGVYLLQQILNENEISQMTGMGYGKEEITKLRKK
jgi:hypothetical protein